MENLGNEHREASSGGSSCLFSSPAIVLRELSSNEIVISLSPPTPPATTSQVPSIRSPLKSITSTISILCRICHEYDNADDLIAPCECSGSMALVHQACLNTWLFMSGRNFCEICGKNLIMPSPENPPFSEPREERWPLSPSWTTILFLFLFSIGLSLFYCTHMTDTNFEFWTALTLVTLNIVACISICFHAFYSPR